MDGKGKCQIICPFMILTVDKGAKYTESILYRTEVWIHPTCHKARAAIARIYKSALNIHGGSARGKFKGKYIKHTLRHRKRSLVQVTAVEMDAPLVQTAVEVNKSEF